MTQLVLFNIFNGLIIGAFYALMALGLSLILNLTGVINFAHGGFLAIGGYLAYTLLPYFGFWGALLLAPILTGFIGILVERVLIRRLYGRDPLYSLLLTFGLAFMIEDGTRFIWGAQSLPFSIPDWLSSPLSSEFFFLTGYRVFMVLLVTLAVAGLFAILNYTRLGIRIRAGTLDLETVSVLGVNVRVLRNLNFGLGIYLAGLAGVLAVGMLGLQPTVGDNLIMPSFIAIIVGGLGSLPGTLLGGLLIGVASGVTSVFFPSASEAVIYVMMAAVLDRAAARAPRRGGALLMPKLDKRAADILLWILLLTAPFWMTHVGSYVELGSRVLVYALAAMSLNFLLGYTGVLSFGHAAYFGLGAYGTALTIKYLYPSTPVGMLVGILIGTVAAAVIGPMIARLRGIYFAMCTIAFGQVFYFIAFQWSSVTGGDDGVSAWHRMPLNLGFTTIDILQSSTAFYYFVLAVVAVCAAAMAFLLRSPFGRTLLAIRENERRARFLGIPVDRHIWMSWVISSLLRQRRRHPLCAVEQLRRSARRTLGSVGHVRDHGGAGRHEKLLGTADRRRDLYRA